MTFTHYSYLYKSGDKITNLEKQISFDEAIVALACLNADISYTVIAKGNVGALSEDITKTPYKALMNRATNSYALLNSVLYMREVERCLQDKKEQVNNNRERLVCIHANRFILHFILKDKEKNENFNMSVIDKDNIRNSVISLLDVFVDRTTQFIDELFPESYPANIFKNSTKCKKLEEKFNSISHN